MLKIEHTTGMVIADDLKASIKAIDDALLQKRWRSRHRSRSIVDRLDRCLRSAYLGAKQRHYAQTPDRLQA